MNTLGQILQISQNNSQYGFTEDITYLMAALQRHEVEKFCIDNKKIFFGCSLGSGLLFQASPSLLAQGMGGEGGI